MSTATPASSPALEGREDLASFRTIDELTALLIRDAGFTDGLYELAMTFNVTVGGFAKGDGSPKPGVFTLIEGVGLRKAKTKGPSVVDAALVNPKR